MAAPFANDDATGFDLAALRRHLTSLYREDLSGIDFRPLGGDAQEALSSVRRLQVELADGSMKQLVLREPRAGAYGLEELEDRARQCLLSYRSFGQTPGHPNALDVGMVDEAGDIVSLAGGRRFFLLEEFVEGSNYGDIDFAAMQSGETPEREGRRADGFARYLAELHRGRPEADPARYRRALREIVGGGEGLMGVIDSYPPAFASEHQDRLSRLEHACLAALQRLRHRPHRLRVTHGDFHPWNILFRDDDDFTAIDRSRCLHADPAIDVGAMLMSYLVLAIRQGGGDAPAMHLARRFLSTYLDLTGDQEILETLPLYTAMRAAAAVSPCFYPDMPGRIRAAVFDVAIAMASFANLDVDLAPVVETMPEMSDARNVR